MGSKTQPSVTTERKPISELSAMARIVRTLEQQPAARLRIMAYLTSLFENKPVANGPLVGLKE